MATIRQQRISGLLREELDIMIGHELEDPRISLVTVTDVIVSRDIRNARVYVHHHDDEVTSKEVLAGLQSATSYLRGQIAIRCGLRSTPDLLFYYDNTPEKAQRIDELLRQIANERSDQQPLPDGATDTVTNDIASDGSSDIVSGNIASDDIASEPTATNGASNE